MDIHVDGSFYDSGTSPPHSHRLRSLNRAGQRTGRRNFILCSSMAYMNEQCVRLWNSIHPGISLEKRMVPLGICACKVGRSVISRLRQRQKRSVSAKVALISSYELFAKYMFSLIVFSEEKKTRSIH
jgi:hypothetical protein